MRFCESDISDNTMVLTSPERRTLSPSRTLPPGMAPTLAERKERATTLPRLQMDEPMFSRNIPSAFSITSCPSDKEELSFSNRWDKFLKDEYYTYIILEAKCISSPATWTFEQQCSACRSEYQCCIIANSKIRELKRISLASSPDIRPGDFDNR